ncbi:MAG: DUF4388 domain-containing protein [Polyangiaceae bacterium]|nr:DUF4388 domain-containing protein [Polyangiaceae bacterium]
MLGNLIPAALVPPAVVRELLSIAAEERSGVLEVHAEGVVTIVYVAGGTPVFAEEGTLGESLGRVLVRQGRLTPDQYSTVIERMTQSVMDSEQVRFGEVAVALEFVTSETIEDGLREQVRAKVARCLQWRDAEFTFRPDAEAVANVTHFPVPIARVLWYGMRRLCDPERCREIWGDDTQKYPDMAADRNAIATELQLSAGEQAFVRLIDGTRTVEHLVNACELDVLLATQLLTTLAYLGSVTLHDEPSEPPSRRMRGPLPPLPFSHPPPQAAAPARPPNGARVSRDSGRHRMRLEAERAFEEGRRLLFADDPRAALPHFLEATRLLPSAGEYLVYAEWTRFLLVELPHERLLKRRELSGVAVRALKQDVTLTIAHYVLAELALLDRNLAGARRALQFALRCDPRHPLVQRFLQNHGEHL